MRFIHPRLPSLALVLFFLTVVGVYSSHAQSGGFSLLPNPAEWKISEWNFFGAANEVPIRTYIPPARKAIIVDRDGFAHRTADNTHLTLRDRSLVVLKLPMRSIDKTSQIEGTQKLGGPTYNFTPNPILNRESLDPEIQKSVHRSESTPAAVPVIESIKVVPDQNSQYAKDNDGVVAENKNTANLAVQQEEAVQKTVSQEAIPEAGQESAVEDTGESDSITTWYIRKALADHPSLATAAKDIQIQTSQGVVLLEGKVQSEKESNDIFLVAQNIAGEGFVDNQLEVAPDAEQL